MPAPYMSHLSPTFLGDKIQPCLILAGFVSDGADRAPVVEQRGALALSHEDELLTLQTLLRAACTGGEATASRVREFVPECIQSSLVAFFFSLKLSYWFEPKRGFFLLVVAHSRAFCFSTSLPIFCHCFVLHIFTFFHSFDN